MHYAFRVFEDDDPSTKPQIQIVEMPAGITCLTFSEPPIWEGDRWVPGKLARQVLGMLNGDIAVIGGEDAHMLHDSLDKVRKLNRSVSASLVQLAELLGMVIQMFTAVPESANPALKRLEGRLAGIIDDLQGNLEETDVEEEEIGLI